MTSLKQIEANRRNGLQSTGPASANGKHVSRRNALRHGFTAQTVLEPLENPEEYRTFEAAILAEYLPQTPVEQELVHRLASLFWRLRRATSIETGLLQMQSEILQAFRSSRQKTVNPVADGGGQEQQERQTQLSVGDRPDDHRHEDDARQRNEVRNTQTLGPGSPAPRLIAGSGALAIPPEYIGPQAIAHNWIPTYAGA